jgi:hypothetical protein
VKARVPPHEGLAAYATLGYGSSNALICLAKKVCVCVCVARREAKLIHVLKVCWWIGGGGLRSPASWDVFVHP